MKKWFLIIVLFFTGVSCFAETFSDSARFAVCFTPQGQCTTLITGVIDSAKKSVLVQAYSFTSRPIISALIRAKQRGIDVRILLDKSNLRMSTKVIGKLKMIGIAMAIDNVPTTLVNNKTAIAHNKVMIIDDKTVITGSFNYTYAAQNRNAENVFVLYDAPKVAKAYTNNWLLRAKTAVPILNR